jgi:hypothetical protein
MALFFPAIATTRRRLRRRELKPFRDLEDDSLRTEIARKQYRQAMKIAGVSDKTARIPEYIVLTDTAALEE